MSWRSEFMVSPTEYQEGQVGPGRPSLTLPTSLGRTNPRKLHPGPFRAALQRDSRKGRRRSESDQY